MELYIVAENGDGIAIVHDMEKDLYAFINLEDADGINRAKWEDIWLLKSAVSKGGYDKLSSPQIYHPEVWNKPMVVATNGDYNVIKMGFKYTVLKIGAPLPSIDKWGNHKLLSSKLIKANYEKLRPPKPYTEDINEICTSDRQSETKSGNVK